MIYPVCGEVGRAEISGEFNNRRSWRALAKNLIVFDFCVRFLGFARLIRD